jgi:hypothetical protein
MVRFNKKQWPYFSDTNFLYLLSHHCDKIPDINNLKEEEFIFDGFREFSP